MAVAEARDDPLQGISYSGGRVFVRNTFLDLDDVPRMPELQRLRTAPDRLQREEEEESDPEQEEPAIVPSSGQQTDFLYPTGSAPADADGDAPPPMEPLYRTVTCNGWEDQHGWKWGGSDDALNSFIDPNDSSSQSSALAPPPPTPSDPSAPMGAMPMPMGGPGQPAGYMMVPAHLLPPGCVGYGPGYMMPPNCQAIPIDPFARWPGGTMPTNMGMPMLGGEMPSQLGMIAATPATGSAAGYSGSAAAPPPPAPLTRVFSVNSGIYRVHWTVDSRKLKSNDKVAVSPQFELSFRTQIPFKMLIHPKFVSEGKGGGSFRKAKGRGKIELKCEGQLEEGSPAWMKYRLSIGSGRAGDTANVQAPRGPVTHNFAQSGVSGLPKESEENPLGDEWMFEDVVDKDSQTFVICLEIYS